ncbi:MULTISPECIES: DUF1120 domain-containing protein [Paraburkholderia]|uniref:DUF1120 domain-containing protein n=1 Tax=Paraburkholderia TaxID=1822464 RepID=UPI0022501C78|nr:MULTISPECIES: DUF1120 domain-containing protein [Paraburkholderia]MCX4163083.1 DUF1120 domain-containing protein [Paraburkholderia megapolitana]MDN7158579.1 DUF1120 domain-containing protein [Paraburkholderia sp. CHISQ3]MDQ6495626.1 DUF1120 domain-containing protein [Paraburkholderia megapolitana]
MKQNISRLAVVITLVTTCMGVHAAQDANIAVTATVKPAACDITLSNGGVFDYGNIFVGELSATTYKVLPEKQIDFSISCNAATRIGLQFTDSNLDSRVLRTSNSTDARIFDGANHALAGLGLNVDKKIGGYGVRIVNPGMTVDGNAAPSLFVNGGGAWVAGITGAMINNASIRTVSWAPTGQLTPVAGKLFAGKVGVQAVLNKSGDIGNVKDTITLDGKGTLTIVYL